MLSCKEKLLLLSLRVREAEDLGSCQLSVQLAGEVWVPDLQCCPWLWACSPHRMVNRVFALRGLCLSLRVHSRHPHCPWLPALKSAQGWSSSCCLLRLLLSGVGNVPWKFPLLLSVFHILCKIFQTHSNIKRMIQWPPIYPPICFNSDQLIPILFHLHSTQSSLSHTQDYFKLHPRHHMISSINISVVFLWK